MLQYVGAGGGAKSGQCRHSCSRGPVLLMGKHLTRCPRPAAIRNAVSVHRHRTCGDKVSRNAVRVRGLCSTKEA
jgi:hypothetical protein